MPSLSGHGYDLTPIKAPTHQWRRTYPLFAVEVALTYCAVGWIVVGLYTQISHPASPAGNAFGAASQFVGSWQVLVGLLTFTAVLSVIGIALDRRRIRQVSMGLSAFNWGFIAAGLSTKGFVSTAVVVYPSLSALAIATYLTVPKGHHEVG